MGNPCESKRFYDTEFEATIAAAKAGGVFGAEMEPYLCPHGTHYHIANTNIMLRGKYRRSGNKTYCEDCDCYLRAGRWEKHRDKPGHIRNARDKERERQ